MALNGEVTAEIAGTQYTFKLGINQMIELEDLYSTPEKRVTFRELMTRVSNMEDPDFKLTRDIVSVALRKHHSELTIEQVGELIDAGGDAIGNVFPKLMNAATPDAADLKALGVRQRRPRNLRTA